MASTYPGEPREALRLEEIPEPVPGEGEVRLQVLAANLNFPDALLVRGQYQIRPPLPFTPASRSAASPTKAAASSPPRACPTAASPST